MSEFSSRLERQAESNGMVRDRLFADLVVLAHFAFVLFVITGLPLVLVGRFRQWSWTRSLVFRLPHVAAILFVVLTAWLGVSCPLTVLENELRQRAGQSGYPGDCIGYWLHELLFYDFPAWVFTLLYDTALRVIWIRRAPDVLVGSTALATVFPRVPPELTSVTAYPRRPPRAAVGSRSKGICVSDSWT